MTIRMQLSERLPIICPVCFQLASDDDQGRLETCMICGKQRFYLSKRLETGLIVCPKCRQSKWHVEEKVSKCKRCKSVHMGYESNFHVIRHWTVRYKSVFSMICFAAFILFLVAMAVIKVLK
jgi:hypothetical protein